jgi:hypothetical protein
MKVAVCLSGQPRFINESCNYLFNSLVPAEVDYFVHFWSDDETEKKNIISKYNPVSYILEKQKVFESDQDLNNNHGKHTKTPHDSSITISSIYSRYAVGQLLKEYTDKNGDMYDFYIWTRSDFCPLTNIISELGDKESVYTAYVEGDIWNDDHFNLVLTCSNLDNMLHFLNLYTNYKKLFVSGIEHCDHRLSMAHMKEKTNNYQQILGHGCGSGDSRCREWGLMRHYGFSKV